MDEKLRKLNRFTRREHTEEEVYLFDAVLCDNDIDRDMECFSEAALAQLQKLFIGKTGIFDHDPRSRGQTARIYDTQLVYDAQKKTADGRPYICLKAQAYMVRTSANADLIREIEGGIKKAVSVSCSAGRQICSVCGADRRESVCGHVKGRTYGDKTCHTILEDIKDAYEWSFVAVPAQVQAGVTKHFHAKEDAGMDLEQKYAQQAELLSKVETQLRAEVLQLCAREKNGTVSRMLRLAAEKLELSELFECKRELLAQKTGVPQVQLAGDLTAQVEDYHC